MTETAPQVSVIMPVYNQVDLLQRSVASVLWQSYADLELIVVDDASSEDVHAALSRFSDSRIRYIRRNSQGGPGAARNTGIEQARGVYLAFQDSDDEWLLDKLERQVETMQQEPESVGLVCCGLIRHHPTHIYHYAPPRPKTEARGEARRWIEQDCKAFCQTWLMRRTLVERLGAFDETLPIWEDWDLLLRVAQSCTVHLTPEPLVVSYADGKGISSRLHLRVRSLERMLAKAVREGQSARLVAGLAYLLGWFRIHAGDMPGARQAFLRALASPHASRACLLYFASFFGARVARRLVSAPSGG